jgi:transposase InsO family protein
VIDDSSSSTIAFANGRTSTNFDRPHGSLGGQTPYERLRQKTTAPA